MFVELSYMVSGKVTAIAINAMQVVELSPCGEGTRIEYQDSTHRIVNEFYPLVLKKFQEIWK